MKSVFSNCFAK